MITGLDSAYPPNADQVAQAKAGGVQLWGGYLATKQGVKLLNPWTQAEFDTVRALGSTPLAFCSGLDDPVACKELAAAWKVRLCLDVEDGILGDGPWVDGWLAASGAGLYGLQSVHSHPAPFRIMANYQSDPGATWNGTPPPEPHGWQWQNTYDAYGATVDRGWYDDWFAQGDEMNSDQEKLLQDIHDQMFPPGLTMLDRVNQIYNATVVDNPSGGIITLLHEIQAQIGAGGQVPILGTLTTAQYKAALLAAAATLP